MPAVDRAPVIPSDILRPFILVVCCFALWGLANNMTDVLVAQFKKIYSLSDLQSSLVQLSFYGAYFCLALPAALLIRLQSYKAAIVLGLGLFALGSFLFYPSAQTMEYNHFLGSLFVLASGLSILETSCNAYILIMGPAETATWRLNLAQSFNPVGSIIGVILGKYLILEGLNQADEGYRADLNPELLKAIQTEELNAVLGPYLSVACIITLLMLLILFSKMPQAYNTAGKIIKNRSQGAFRRLFSNTLFTRGVLAQFLYVGCQIGCWSFTIRYVIDQMGGTESEASYYLLLSIILVSIGRFICTSLMYVCHPATLLGFFAGLATLFTSLVAWAGGETGIYALVGVSGCMSLMFPTLYGLSLKDVDQEDIALGGSFMVMAIVGGAVMTILMGFISDIESIQAAFFAPMLGFAYLFYFSLYVRST